MTKQKSAEDIQEQIRLSREDSEVEAGSKNLGTETCGAASQRTNTPVMYDWWNVGRFFEGARVFYGR